MSRFGMPFLAELGPLASADPTIFTSFSSLYPSNGFPHVSHGSQLQRFVMASITSRSTTSPSVSASSAVLSTSTILTLVNSTKDSDPQTDDSKTIRFTKVQDLFNRIDHTSGDSLTVISMVLPFYFYMVY